ncbi:thymidylate kinase isoform X4 [Ochotona curzoniae]|uniref:thymidylate kinase isoform X4 n=1 Tax=Ochotona curzoniae TaxID=130825 RepID=UPI001B34A308|nr:thymidylate kinase isoform X4 [Ochotona curzoniae]
MAGRRGALIVLEGMDRSGKTTQSHRLVSALRTAGHRAELLRFPERSTEIGKLLSSYLEKKSDMEDHSNFSLEWCKQPDVGLPKPDLVLFLQLQLAEAAARGEFGLERYESRAFQEQALERFQQLMSDTSLNWKTVDASRSIEDVHEEIRVLSEEAIACAAWGPLGELWK